MAHKHASTLEEYSTFLESGLEMLKGNKQPELIGINNRLRLHFTQDMNFVQSLLGYTKDAPEDERAHLQPLKEMFGQSILHVPVTAKDTNPTDFEKRKFVGEVDDFYSNFLNLTDEKIFNKSTLPGGEMVIRAVAKKSGYADYETAEIDVDYITAVKKSISEKIAEQKTLNDAAKKTK